MPLITNSFCHSCARVVHNQHVLRVERETVRRDAACAYNGGQERKHERTATRGRTRTEDRATVRSRVADPPQSLPRHLFLHPQHAHKTFREYNAADHNVAQYYTGYCGLRVSDTPMPKTLAEYEADAHWAAYHASWMASGVPRQAFGQPLAEIGAQPVEILCIPIDSKPVVELGAKWFPNGENVAKPGFYVPTLAQWTSQADNSGVEMVGYLAGNEQEYHIARGHQLESHSGVNNTKSGNNNHWTESLDEQSSCPTSGATCTPASDDQSSQVADGLLTCQSCELDETTGIAQWSLPVLRDMSSKSVLETESTDSDSEVGDVVMRLQRRWSF